MEAVCVFSSPDLSSSSVLNNATAVVGMVFLWSHLLLPRVWYHHSGTDLSDSRHGKFRPSLMKLVSSNNPKTLKETIRKAVAQYHQAKKQWPQALDILTQLKGIGPATASLLLAVHAPDNIIFFADEAFYWLEYDGSKGPIKYNKNEYSQLTLKAQALAKRLGVRAVDIEKVAFAIMRDDYTQASEKAAATAEKAEENDKGAATDQEDKPATKTEPEEKTTKSKPPAKRKTSGDNADTNAPIRRSKRGKQA